MPDSTPTSAPHLGREVDLSKPNSARIYDWYLGGAHNFEVDREFGKQVTEQAPLAAPIAQSNRRWLGRVVRAACQAGITQFLDLGSGVPTVGNVHEIVRAELGDGPARVVYVDNEHVAATHSRLVLEEQGADRWVGVVQRDYRHPEPILTDAETRRVLDFDHPVCVILASVLQFVGPDDRPGDVVGQFREPLVPGSWLAISHPTVEDADADGAARLQQLFSSYVSAGTPAWLRTREDLAEWVQGLDRVAPGLVHAPEWRPELGGGGSTDPPEVFPYYWTVVGQVPAE